MSDSASSSTREYSDDSQQCIIEAMESIITDLHIEVKQLNEEIDKRNTKITTFQSIIKSDILEKMFDFI